MSKKTRQELGNNVLKITSKGLGKKAYEKSSKEPYKKGSKKLSTKSSKKLARFVRKVDWN